MVAAKRLARDSLRALRRGVSTASSWQCSDGDSRDKRGGGLGVVRVAHATTGSQLRDSGPGEDPVRAVLANGGVMDPVTRARDLRIAFEDDTGALHPEAQVVFVAPGLSEEARRGSGGRDPCPVRRGSVHPTRRS